MKTQAAAVLGGLLLTSALACTVRASAWTHEVVHGDLAYPWDIQSNGDQLFITEVTGHILSLPLAGGRGQRVAVRTSDPVVNEGGSGLLGMALAPDFAQSGMAYLFHTYRTEANTGTGLANKLIEVRHANGQWREIRVLLSGIPGHPLYNGGRIAIGPDGHLYVTTGWARNSASAQDLKSLAGKVLRLRLDGSVPPDNPFPGSFVWSYGHRNPQGLAWDSDGRLFVVEHGESGHDEINLVTPGGNYGWPHTVGEQRRAEVTPPMIDSGSATWAPSGAAFFNGRLLVAGLRERSLRSYDPQAGTMQVIFSSGDRLRAVLPVGDMLYVLTTNTSPRDKQLSGPDRLLKLAHRP